MPHAMIDEQLFSALDIYTSTHTGTHARKHARTPGAPAARHSDGNTAGTARPRASSCDHSWTRMTGREDITTTILRLSLSSEAKIYKGTCTSWRK